MTFRRRVTLVSTVAVALAMALASIVLFLLVRHQMYAEVDRSLTTRAHFARLSFNNTGGTFGLPRVAPGGAEGFTQFVSSNGKVIPPPFRGPGPRFPIIRFQLPGSAFVRSARSASAVPNGPPRPFPRPDQQRLPISHRTVEVARGEAGTYLADVEYRDVNYRVLTFRLSKGTAVEVARPLDEVDSVSHDLLRILAIVFVGSIGLSLLLGSFVMRALTGPVRKLTAATEHVAESQDLSRRIEISGSAKDELGRLAHSFNEMMEALESATNAQRQLIDDASHELRTPLTSLRTNMDVLLRGHQLDDGTRTRLVRDVSEQLDELSQLVGDLVDLASGNEDSSEPLAPIDLDDVMREAVTRAQRLAPYVTFELSAHTGTRVIADRDQLHRAVGNLLTNAVKYAPGKPVEIAVNVDGEVTVRDFGPGVADTDKLRIFERFYRADDARDMPGSGLGLAIARKVVERLGGRLWVTDAPGGGACFHLTLRVTRESLPDDGSDEPAMAATG